MSIYEHLTLIVAAISAVISTVALVRTRKTEKRQLELQETQASLAAFQHKLLAAEHEATSRADLRITLTRGRPAHFQISNVGASAAHDVNVGFVNLGPRKTPLVMPDQFGRLFPIEEFLPGQSHRFAAVLTTETPIVLEGEISWRDPGGISQSRKFKLS